MQLDKFLEMQRELDTFIATEKNLGYAYDKKFLESRTLALRVEVAELANETRCFKYWSTKGTSSKEVIMDEAADVLHFILSLINLENTYIQTDLKEIEEYSKLMFGIDKNIELVAGFNQMYVLINNSDWEGVLMNLVATIVILGYSIEDLENAYLKKHKENYKRQENNY